MTDDKPIKCKLTDVEYMLGGPRSGRWRCSRCGRECSDDEVWAGLPIQASPFAAALKTIHKETSP